MAKETKYQRAEKDIRAILSQLRLDAKEQNASRAYDVEVLSGSGTLADINKQLALSDDPVVAAYARDMVSGVKELLGVPMGARDFRSAAYQIIDDVLRIATADPIFSPAGKDQLRSIADELRTYVQMRTNLSTRTRNKASSTIKKISSSIADSFSSTDNVLLRSVGALIRNIHGRQNAKADASQTIAQLRAQSTASALTTRETTESDPAAVRQAVLRRIRTPERQLLTEIRDELRTQRRDQSKAHQEDLEQQKQLLEQQERLSEMEREPTQGQLFDMTGVGLRNTTAQQTGSTVFQDIGKVVAAQGVTGVLNTVAKKALPSILGAAGGLAAAAGPALLAGGVVAAVVYGLKKFYDDAAAQGGNNFAVSPTLPSLETPTKVVTPNSGRAGGPGPGRGTNQPLGASPSGRGAGPGARGVLPTFIPPKTSTPTRSSAPPAIPTITAPTVAPSLGRATGAALSAPRLPAAPTVSTSPVNLGPMGPSSDLLDFIEQMEGFNPVPVPDTKGWQVGFGTRWWDGKEVTKSYPAVPVTRDQARAQVQKMLTGFTRTINTRLKVPVSQAQFDALASVAYNKGNANDLINKLNQGKTLEYEDFARTATTRNKFGISRRGKDTGMWGLELRRAREYTMFSGHKVLEEALSAGPNRRGQQRYAQFTTTLAALRAATPLAAASAQLASAQNARPVVIAPVTQVQQAQHTTTVMPIPIPINPRNRALDALQGVNGF